MGRSSGVRTLRTLDTSDPRHFGTGAEMSNGHFGTTVKIRDTSALVRTTVKIRDTSALVPKCPRDTSVSWTFRHHLHFVYSCVTLIYLFKKDYFIDDWWHIFRYFLYRPTTSLKFFVQGMQHTTELPWPLLYHGDANANIFIEANSFLFLSNRLSLTRIFAVSVRPPVLLLNGVWHLQSVLFLPSTISTLWSATLF